MDRRLLSDLNRLAVHAGVAQHALGDAVRVGWLAVLGLLTLLAFQQSRRHGLRSADRPDGALVALALPGAGLAYLVAWAIAAGVGRAAPTGVLVLVTGESGLPSRLAAAAATLAGLLACARTRWIGTIALLVAVVEVLGVVVVGASYPSDAAGGLALGLAAVLALVALRRAFLGSASVSATGLMVGVNGGGPASGPAARPAPPAPTGSVTVLSSASIRPRPGLGGDGGA